MPLGAIGLKPIIINDKEYYTVSQFASLIGRTTQTVYRLIKAGNAIRKLKCDYVLGKPVIPVSEYEEFPFCEPGPYGVYNVFKFGKMEDKNG